MIGSVLGSGCGGISSGAIIAGPGAGRGREGLGPGWPGLGRGLGPGWRLYSFLGGYRPPPSYLKNI
jgi:hypothetical protein